MDEFTILDVKNAEHQYDYVLHIDGQFEKSSAPLGPQAGKLGEICGYQLVEQTQRGSARGTFNLTFVSEAKQLRVTVKDEDATEIIIADGLTNSPDRKMTMLILRRKAARTQFTTVLEPVSATDAPRR